MSNPNIFSRQPQTQGNIFSTGQSQGQSNNLFNNNSQSQGSGLFNNSGGSNTPTNNMFTSQSQGGSNNLFANNQQGSNNLFNRQGTGTSSSTGTTTNLFNQGGTTLFSQPSSTQSGGLFNNSYNQSTSYNTNAPKYPVNPNCPVNQSKVYELMQVPLDQQKRLFQNFEPQYLKQLIAYYCKSIETLKTERFQLPVDNPLRSEKIAKVVTQLNIKPQIIQVKRTIRDNLTLKLKKLKQDKQKLDNQSINFSRNVFQKLQKYKERLVISVTQNKMIEEIKKQLDEIELEIKDFFTPLFNAQQTRNYVNFVDPNPFCVNLSEKLLKNMTMLENRVDQILACDGDDNEQNIDTGDVIMQLVEYYQNVAVALKDYSAKYNELKRKAMQRSGQRNPEQTFKKLSEKANSIVKKEMEGYELVKQIENLLQRREKRLNQRKQ